MHITLIGYGKMGKTIHRMINEQFPQITEVTIIDENTPLTAENTRQAHVFIDFSTPAVFVPNLTQLLDLRPNAKIVAGTTGWYDQLEHVQELLTAHPEAGMIYSGNFSIGIHNFWKILELATRLFAKYTNEYDVFGHEFHHRQKSDSPGGTAKQTAELILKNFPSKKQIQYDLATEQIDPETLHFSSTRGGHIPGIHSVYFDSVCDTVEVTHIARNRDGFALGAVKSAFWILKKSGLFTIQDFLKDLNNE